MGRVLPVAVIIASSASCAQLVGIDDTSGTARVDDSVSVQRMSIGKTVVLTPLDLTGLRANYLVANAGSATGFDRVAATDAGNGKWVTKLHDPTPVELTFPDVPTPLPRIYGFPVRTLSLLFGALEHPGRLPAPEGATLAFTVALDAPYVNETFQVYTVGAWTSRPFLATELPQAPATGAMAIGPVTYAYNTSTNLSGRPQLDALTLQDPFLILRYDGPALTGVAETAIEQTGNDAVNPPMATVVRDQLLDVKLDASAVAGRFSIVRPQAPSLSMRWSLIAAPGYRVAFFAGPALQSGMLVATDTGVSVMYGNPFVLPPRSYGWNTMFALFTTASRVYTPAGTMTPVNLEAGMNQFIEPSPRFELKLEAGLPELILIDGQSLSRDGLTIPQPKKLAAVTFSADHPTNTLYALEVYDLQPNAMMTGLDRHLVIRAFSSEQHFDVPPENFQVGHSYTLRVLCSSGGYPAIGEGDFTNRQLPLSQSYLDSGVFTVTAAP